MTQHRNSEGERIAIERKTLRGNPVLCLVIYDDAPPEGTGQAAPMLLDEGTRNWLREELAKFADDPLAHRAVADLSV